VVAAAEEEEEEERADADIRWKAKWRRRFSLASVYGTGQ
jgi:hypothetical protein